MPDLRHKFLAHKLMEGFGFSDEDAAKEAEINACLESDDNAATVDAFFTLAGPPKLLFYYQIPEAVNDEGDMVPTSGAPVLFMTVGDTERQAGTAVYFIRTATKADVKDSTVEQDVVTGALHGAPLDAYRALLSNLYLPILQEQGNWGKSTEDATAEFLAGAGKFSTVLTEAANSLMGGVELKKPDKKYVDGIEQRPNAFAKAASDQDIAEHMEVVLEDWCTQTEKLLDESDTSRQEPEDAGPDTELEYWRNRMAKFNSITEQLKSKECKLVLGVTMAARSKAHRNWKNIDVRVTDSANEAKDNVKYLSTLEKSLEAMYTGTPHHVIEGLPALMNSVKMMHTIARYYNTPERMTTLFCKISNQMITCCKQFILASGKLWDQDKLSLVENLRVALKLNEAYQDQYKQKRDQLSSQPKGKQFEFNESKIFAKFDLFCKRVTKLIDMFTTVHQFTSLASHTHIDGLEQMIANFFTIVEDFKKKPYDLLDYQRNQFDRDHLEFNVNIHDLETTLQGFINGSFENITSTDHALNLLRQFQAILQRDTLKADLDDKYMVIFQNYGLDLDAVQKIYEKHKHAPPLVRNAPPVAGDIMWSRQLLRRIELPMKKFATNQSIMNTKESKRIVKTYNRVARALIEFETLWHQAWIKSIDSAKAGLSATLIVRHPDSGALLVNFDREIVQLIRETKWLQRIGVEVPEAAKMVLLQEAKFKHYYQQLTYTLKEYDRVMGTISSIVKPLLSPHLEDMERKIQPGMYILTWTSMNIDGFLHRIHAGLSKLEELIAKIQDVVDNRIEANLKSVSKTMLVDLPDDRSFTYEDFVTTQARFIKRQSDALVVCNQEVERAVDAVADVIEAFPRDNVDSHVSEEAKNTFRRHYAKLMYQAILSAVKLSFTSMKKRLGSRSSGGFLFVERPFFDVDVELSIPSVSMNPSLDDIQGAVNATAKKILGCCTNLKSWGTDNPNGTFYDLIAADREVVKSVLLLTGSIEGTKNQVMEYIATFAKYDFLWKLDMAAEYSEFMRNKPTLEQFEAELKKYMAIEQEISRIAPVHNIGALSLETQPMKYSLKAEAVAWKSQFAQNLHAEGLSKLKAIHEYLKATTLKLNRKIEDLEDVRAVMGVLKEVREKEAEIDNIMSPIEEEYGLLTRYDVRVPKEETDLVSDLRYAWKKVLKQATDVSENLSRLQVGFKRDLIKEVKVFVVDAQTFRQDFENNGPMVPGLEPMEAVDRLKKFKQMFDVRKRKWDNYSSGEELFGLSVTQYPELEKTEQQLDNLDRLYGLYVDVIETIDSYSEVLWVDVVAQIDEMTEQVNAFQGKCKKLPKSLRGWKAFNDCKECIDNFLELLPLISALTSKSMRDRHWADIMRITGKQLNLSEDVFKLKDLLDADPLKYQEEMEELASAAVKEEQVEVKLAEIAGGWADTSFDFADYKTRGPVILAVSTTAEVIEKLEDSQMQLGSMATNRYSAPFRDDVNKWIEKLSTVSEVVEMWLMVQSMWQYMEAVFSGGDIAKQLPQESKRFANIDKNYMKIVSGAFETRNVVATCYGNEVMKTLLPHLLEQLEITQKSLNQYLDQKRALFPRFYFVSDPTLLELLSLGSDPVAVQQHFQSGLFDAITRVTFDKVDKTKMLEMFSPQGEKVPFFEPCNAVGNIEDWLQSLVNTMQGTVKEVIKKAHDEVDEKSVDDFVFNTPAQIALLGIQFQWTKDTQGGLALAKQDKGVMNKVMRKTDGILKDMIVTTTRVDLSKIERTNIETCITVHVHQRDTSDDLLKKKIRDPTDFEWLKQARFYWRADRDNVIISICDVDFVYSYEYLGVKERLVITPLTDICYVTLSQALGMYLGGAPAGPAGTGKTETTKDLGNTLGKFVVVFNCSDQFDHKYMGKIYKGLAQSGLWGCFDEFNRINLDVLSVCAQQVSCILTAIREHKKEFVFTDGSTTSLDDRVGFFITMNPGYAGRQELPENLKSLFRGVTMMVPNRQIIKKVKLAACGYQENEILSKKFFILYGLCEMQLSKQAHYDFGLRNILSVLRTMGSSKRANPDKSESFLAMRTLRDMNMSKFVAEDVPLFLSLIEDLFIGLKADKASFPDVEREMRKTMEERGLQDWPTWFAKCIQLYETYQVRHGIMLVGPSGGGKTTIMEVLATALTALGTKHEIKRMNPKSITAPQMFGRLDAATGDWTDGIFAVLWRKAAKAKNVNTWVTLDGPVDAIWIENLNTVLDDNKVLTLANGDRIPMSPAMKAMFEPENLRNASPATVSRAGIIYVSDVELGWQPVSKSWLQKRRKEEAHILQPLFDHYVQPMFDLLRLDCHQMLHNETVCTFGTLLSLLASCLKAAEEENEILSEGHYERLFLYCLTWSLGALVDLKDRLKVDAEIRRLCKDGNVPSKGENEDQTIYEYYVSDENTEWTHWENKLETWQYPVEVEKPKFAQLVIPTLDSIRYEYMLHLAGQVGKATLFVGGAGTAKSTTVLSYMGKFNPEEMAKKLVTFSSLTTPGIFQMTVEGAVEKRQGRTFGPPGGKKMILFVDDVSMPEVNTWGDQVTNEIVRQLLEQGGMYALDKPGDMKFIKDVTYVGAMNTPGGGKNDVPHRFKRQFCIFFVPPPSKAAINNIFGGLVSGRFDAERFSAEDIELATKLVPSTIEIWEKVQTKMLPTPAKFHYLFNLRELSKVFQGVILMERDRIVKGDREELPEFGGKITSPGGYILSCWKHECERVFMDKLTDATDKNWLRDLLSSLIKRDFGPELLAQVSEPVYFVDFLREPVLDEETGEVIDANPSFYEICAGGLAEIRKICDNRQADHNSDPKKAKLDLVLFTDALEHLLRIARLLCMDRGSGLLVGVGGSGKQSLTRLASYISGSQVFQITVTKTYNVVNLLEDMKNVYKLAGFKGQKMTFLFTDAEIKDEGFLEFFNQLLMTGEVTGMMAKDELDMCVNDIRPVMKKEAPQIVDSYENLYNFFLGRARDNFHVMLCFSPVGPNFARRAQQFPGLINGVTIDWFLPWPLEALTAVSGKFITDFEMDCSDQVKGQLIEHMGGVHNSVKSACDEYFAKFRRNVYVTPKSYLSFLAGYKTLYSTKVNEVKELAEKINSGLSKLFEAKEDVNKMKGELAIKNTELAEAQKKSEALLKEISASTAIAEKEKKKVAVIVESVSKKAAEISAVKEDAERDLAKAQPALDAAVAALNSITPKDIQGLKALKNPPDVVKRIFDAVLVLRMYPVKPKISYSDVKGAMVLDANYEESVRMMGDSAFLSQLMNFPKEQINDETCELLLPYFAAPDFNFESAQKASGNVAGLCNWANAMETYHFVAKEVEPKIIALREAEGELKAAEKEKAAAESNMAQVQAKLDEMQAGFDAAMAEKQRLEDDALATQKKMDSANALIGALGGEEVRWTAQSAEFDAQIQRLTGDCAIASSFTSYLGPFNKEFRDLLQNRDFYGDCVNRGIPVTQDLKVTDFMADATEKSEWNLQGLPTDELSVQNGIMVTRATRYPVLIDPQGQGINWIKNREEQNMLKTTSLQDKYFRNHLEDCLSFGKPMLIENIEEVLDPVLDPVLEKRAIKKGKGYMIALADKECDFTPTFCLFATTRLPNPHFTPEMSAKVTVIDFTVTMAGLEDQLLAKLILKEKHELEEQRQQLVEEVASYRKKIKQLEDDLLYRLSSSTGNLLDDTELIDVLAMTKSTAQEVGEKLQTANETNVRITEACEEYRSIAHRAGLIYFLIADFSKVNVMYQTSLAQFNDLYLLAIDLSEKAAMPSKRINNIIEYLTYSVYLYIQRGLFERHKLVFALMLTNAIQISAKKLTFDDVGIFLKGGAALDINAVRKKPKDWLSDMIWLNIVATSSMSTFNDLQDSVYRNDGLWRQWYDLEEPEKANVPDYNDRMTKFDKMVITKAFRVDRTLIVAQEYIADAIGQRFVESVPLNMEYTWSESTPRIPLICLLSAGADPTKLIEDLAKKKKIKTLGVSMGQGQEVIARKYLSSATVEGHWVLLQNMHLGLAYLSEVEQFLVKADELHEDFRLWITAEPHPQFPIGLLQMSIKITNEAPVGMKAGLRASYAWVNQDMIDTVQRFEWRQLLFVQCFLHSVVQERRKFGPIGWNIRYEYNASDLNAITMFLQNHVMEMEAKKAPSPTWPTVRYMVNDIQYGGRITDDFDQLLMGTYAEKYYHQGVLEKGYELFPGYKVPDSTDIAVFRAEIEKLPPSESPEIFGLHPNADLTFREIQVSEAVTTIMDTMPKSGGGGSGKSREEIVDEIAEDLLGKVPKVFGGEDTKEKLKKVQGGATAPLNVHLRQEIDRLNRIMKLTQDTLINLRLAIAGTVALAGPLIDALDALFDARIPANWTAISWEAGTLGVWFVGMQQRYDQLFKWLNSGRPKAYWMTGFFNPQGFLTAMKQEVNRKHAAEKWALDDVVMSSEVTHPPKEVEALRDAPNEGVYVYGLYLDGCAWSGKENRLVDSEPKKLFHALPVLFVTGVQQKDVKKDGIYDCPTYRVKKRTGLNFITTFQLRTEDPKQKWIMRGVALLCSVD